MAFKPLKINDLLEQSPSIRPLLNVAPIIDVVTGSYQKGVNGEYILNGGIMNFVSFVGEGNTMKSTVMNSITTRIMAHHPWIQASTYDTEVNFQATRMAMLASQYPELKDEDWVSGTGRYTLTSKVEMQGDDWFEKLKEYGRNKEKAKDQRVTTPFLDAASKDKKAPLSMLFPNIHLIDSISEFQTSEADKKMEKNAIDDKDLSTYYMNDGMHKTRLITELPKVTIRSSQYVLCTAHVANTINLGVMPERKRLGYMRQGQKIKKVPSNFEFLTHQCWEIIHARPLLSSDKTGPMYPTGEAEGSEAKTDLYDVTFHGLRNKSGLSGVPITLLVSQTSGVLWDLSNYHHITQKNFGVDKVGFGFKLDFYPDVSCVRTTIRNNISADRKLARAAELLCELSLIYQLHDEWPNRYRIHPRKIYETLIEKGYDWNKILETRGYWMFKEEEDELKPSPYLSAADLPRMCVDEYIPAHLKKSST